MKLSKTLRFGACGFSEEPRRNEVLGKSLAHLARSCFHAEHVPDDELVAARCVFAHHAFEVGVGDVLRRLVFDLATCLGGLQRLVQAADPLLLEGRGVDPRDLEFGLREGHAGAPCCHGDGQGDGAKNHLTTLRHGAFLIGEAGDEINWRNLPATTHGRFPPLRWIRPVKVYVPESIYPMVNTRGPKCSARSMPIRVDDAAFLRHAANYFVPKIRSPASPRPGRM